MADTLKAFENFRGQRLADAVLVFSGVEK